TAIRIDPRSRHDHDIGPAPIIGLPEKEHLCDRESNQTTNAYASNRKQSPKGRAKSAFLRRLPIEKYSAQASPSAGRRTCTRLCYEPPANSSQRKADQE